MSRYFTVAIYGRVCGIEKSLWYHFFGCNAASVASLCCCACLPAWAQNAYLEFRSNLRLLKQYL